LKNLRFVNAAEGGLSQHVHNKLDFDGPTSKESLNHARENQTVGNPPRSAAEL
jgi:hypothetical protein